jgi:tetratricopeptide (TPR) repeat protein
VLALAVARMRTRQSILLTLVSTIGILAGCKPPSSPTCEPGERCGPSTVRPQLSPEQAQAQLADMLERYGAAATDGLDARECGELIEGFQALYERDDSILVARFNVAAIHEACGQAKQAEAIYAELAEREFPSALNNLGVIAWDRGEHERAFGLFERAVAADSTHAVASRNNLAMALRERYASTSVTADFDQAERHLQSILAVDSSNKVAYENLARLYYDRGRTQDSSYLLLAELVITQAQRILEARGLQSGDLHNLSGLLLMEQDDQIRALKAFRQAVEVEPDHIDAHRNIAMIALRFRDYESAERSLESALEVASVANDIEAWIALGVAKRGLRKYDDAERAYRQALTLDTGDPRPWYNLGILAQEHRSGLANDEDEVTATYQLALENYQTFVEQAGASPRWRAAVVEAKDRIAVVKDSIEAIEKIRQTERDYEAMLELEAQQRLEEIERLRKLESESMGVGDPVGQ